MDTLRTETAYDYSIMPNLNNFAKNEGIKFLEHRAQGNMTVPSVIPLMTSRYSREIGPIAFTYAADPKMRKNFYDKQIPLMASTMQNLGYRVGGIGWLSLFSEAMQGGLISVSIMPLSQKLLNTKQDKLQNRWVHGLKPTAMLLSFYTFITILCTDLINLL